MKRYDGRTKPQPTKHHEKGYKPMKRSRSGSDGRRDSSSEVHPENKCLIRAHLDDKKISTIVASKDMNRFQQAYANLLKGNLHGLKKKDKKAKTPASGPKTTAKTNP